MEVLKLTSNETTFQIKEKIFNVRKKQKREVFFSRELVKQIAQPIPLSETSFDSELKNLILIKFLSSVL